jgi:hypothetical protein
MYSASTHSVNPHSYLIRQHPDHATLHASTPQHAPTSLNSPDLNSGHRSKSMTPDNHLEGFSCGVLE